MAIIISNYGDWTSVVTRACFRNGEIPDNQVVQHKIKGLVMDVHNLTEEEKEIIRNS